MQLPECRMALGMFAAGTLSSRMPGEDVHYTHYDYLEIAPDVTRAAIDVAYARRLEELGHGARTGGTGHSALIARIHDAYGVLSNPGARKAYDARLAQEAALADAELKAALDTIAARAQRALRTDTLTAGTVACV